MEAKIISLSAYKKKKRATFNKQKLFYLSKAELLQELINYYEDIKKDPFNVALALWGEDLIDVISLRALTRELNDLVERYQKNGPFDAFKMD